MRLLRKLFGAAKSKKPESPSQEVAKRFNDQQARIRQAGARDGSHYTDSVDRVKQLKREKRHKEAIELLLKLVDATESESKAAGRGWGVAPWYYEQLAIIYRKEKRIADEVAILERYEAQPKAPGAGPSKLKERLAKANESGVRVETHQARLAAACIADA